MHVSGHTEHFLYRYIIIVCSVTANMHLIGEHYFLYRCIVVQCDRALSVEVPLKPKNFLNIC